MESNSQARIAFAAVATLCLAPLLASTAAAQISYKIDDGVPETAMGYGLPADYVWMNRFKTVNTYDTITSVELMFSDVPNGTPVTVCVWDDIDEDGNPNGALLVSRVDGVVSNSGQPVFNRFDVPPGKVRNIFFVGAFITVDAQYPATVDKTTPSQQRAWSGADAPGYLDPEMLPMMYPMETIGTKGVFMVRAIGTGSGFPGVVLYGTGTPGCTGAEPLAPNASPKIGNATFALVGDKAPALSLGLGLIADAQAYRGIDPFGVGVLLHVDLLAATQVLALDVPSDAAGHSVSTVPIPNDPTLVGKDFFAQLLWAWPTATCVLPPYNLSSTNGVALKIQN
ncbi:MAG: hypothetical protein JNJ88_13905 [Planctomycetes bacterium]|nr:hypothetical protein [Planctomycetota bacterium]